LTPALESLVRESGGQWWEVADAVKDVVKDVVKDAVKDAVKDEELPR